ncbi:MAG: CHAT domain-containing tetratricopeptide repeat protein [Blastocatellia bacterium]
MQRYALVRQCLGWTCFILCLVLSEPVTAQSADQAAVQRLVEQYYQLYAQQDVNGVLRLWSEQAPTYKSVKADFSRETGGATITLQRVRLNQWQSETDKVAVRAIIELIWKDSATAMPAPRLLVQNLWLAREGGQWKIWQNTSLYDEIAARIDSATSDVERLRWFQQESELTPADLVTAIYRVAFQHNARGKYAQSSTTAQFALQMAEKFPDSRMVPRCLNLLGINYYAEGKFEPALNAFQKALPLLEEYGLKASAASTVSNIGGIYYGQGAYDQALEYFRRSLRLQEELGNKAGIAAALTNIGAIATRTGYYAEATQHLERSLKIREELGQKTGVGPILNNLGTAYNAQGRTSEALSYYLRNLKLQKELGNQADSITSQLNIASIHNESGRYDQALVYAQSGLQLAEQLKLDEKRIYALNIVGEIYYWQKKHDLALSALQQSLELQEQVKTQVYRGAALNLIASVYQEQRRFPLALENYQRALQAYQAINDRLGVILTQNDLGSVQHEMRQYETALRAFAQAETLAREINSPSGLITAYEGQGKALRALNRPGEARQAYQNAVRAIEQLVPQIGVELEQRLGFQHSHATPYFALTDLLIEQQDAQQALVLAEQAKSRVLLDSLQNGRLNIARVLSSEEREAEAKALARLSALNSQLTQAAQEEKPDNSKFARLKTQQIEARQTYEALQTQLFAAHPELKVRRGETAPLALDETAAMLGPQTALLEFASGETRTHLFVITARNGKPALQTFTIPLKRQELAAKTEKLRQTFANRNLGYVEPARELYDLLLKPAAAALQGKSRLVIVPDGPLWELPFQALMPTANRFLIEDKTISTAPSLTFLREMIRVREKRGKQSAPANILVVGNPALGGEELLAKRAELMGDKLEPLPFAEQQATLLGQLYKTNAKVLTGAVATEATVKAEMGKYRILHLATHGVLDDRNPMYSHLVLAQTGNNKEGGQTEDGLLEARELLDMDLQADLAVLSACETGRGKIGAGEGMIGLSWALFVAGVPTTVVSQWKVADKSTAELMVAFHQQLQAGQPKAEALRRAAQPMLKQPNSRHPFYWAGFTLVGDGF